MCLFYIHVFPVVSVLLGLCASYVLGAPQTGISASMHCVSVCSCYLSPPITIDCSASSLATIPNRSLIDAEVEMLIMTNNIIRSINTTHRFENYTHLRVLDISFNRISELHENAFHGIGAHLKEMYLQNNRLHSLPMFVFKYLNGLQKLDISHNCIRVIGRDTFAQLDKLQILNISDNGIGVISERSFEDVVSLTHLDISNNPMQYLPSAIFRNLADIKHINLRNTSLFSIAKGTFAHNANLQHLDLSQNRIATIRSSVVNDFTAINLGYINTSANPFICDCQMVGFWHYLLALAPPLNERSEATCAKPRKLRGRPLTALDTDELTCFESSAMRLIFIQITTPKTIPKATKGPLVYNPIVGLKTGGALSAMLLLALVCIGTDKVKLCCHDVLRWRMFGRKLQDVDEEEAGSSSCGEGDGGVDDAAGLEHKVTLRINRDGMVTSQGPGDAIESPGGEERGNSSSYQIIAKQQMVGECLPVKQDNVENQPPNNLLVPQHQYILHSRVVQANSPHQHHQAGMLQQTAPSSPVQHHHKHQHQHQLSHQNTTILQQSLNHQNQHQQNIHHQHAIDSKQLQHKTQHKHSVHPEAVHPHAILHQQTLQTHHPHHHHTESAPRHNKPVQHRNVNDGGSGVEKFASKRHQQGKSDFFGLHILQVHPDCPIHSPNAQSRLRDLISMKTGGKL